MATTILLNASVEFGEIDLSTHVTNVGLVMGAETVDVTTMGTHSGWRQMRGGLKTWTATVEVLADESAIGGLFDMLGKTATLIVKAENDDVSEANPAYVGQATLTSYEPISGGVGEAAGMTCTFENAGALVRITSEEEMP